MADATTNDQKLDAILTELKKINEPDDTAMANSVKLTSSSNTLALTSKYYYTVAFFLVGTVTSDVKVNIQGPTTDGQGFSNWYINNTVAGYKIEGIPVSQITVETTNLSTATVYLAFIGYKKPHRHDVKIL